MVLCKRCAPYKFRQILSFLRRASGAKSGFCPLIVYALWFSSSFSYSSKHLTRIFGNDECNRKDSALDKHHVLWSRECWRRRDWRVSCWRRTLYYHPLSMVYRSSGCLCLFCKSLARICVRLLVIMRFTATCLQCVSVIHTDPDSSLSSITLYGCNVCDWHGYAYKVVVVVFPLYLFCSPLMLRFATDSVIQPWAWAQRELSMMTSMVICLITVVIKLRIVVSNDTFSFRTIGLRHPSCSGLRLIPKYSWLCFFQAWRFLMHSTWTSIYFSAHSGR